MGDEDERWSIGELARTPRCPRRPVHGDAGDDVDVRDRFHDDDRTKTAARDLWRRDGAELSRGRP